MDLMSNRELTKGKSMETMAGTDAVEAPLDKQILTLKKRDRRLAWLAGILAVAVVAMGAWLIFGNDGGQSLTGEQEQMLETVNEAHIAWNAGDGEALAALYAPDGYHDNGRSRYNVADGQLARYVETIHAMDFSVEQGEIRVYDNYVVSYDFSPAGSEAMLFGIHAMSPDGKTILWHYVP